MTKSGRSPEEIGAVLLRLHQHPADTGHGDLDLG